MSVSSLLAVTNPDYYNDYSSADTGGALTGMGMIIVIGIVLYLLIGFLLYKIFQKAGRPGWAGFVPIYNGWVLFEISGKPGWWVLFGFIPYIGWLIVLVLSLLAALELAKRFGKSELFGIFGLWLFSVIGYAILAFDNSKYHVVTNTSATHPNTASN